MDHYTCVSVVLSSQAVSRHNQGHNAKGTRKQKENQEQDKQSPRTVARR